VELYYSLARKNVRKLFRIGGSLRTSVKYHSFACIFLTKICWKRILGQCLVGSLTGAVACSRVMQVYKGQLSADGNRAGRIKAKAGLTVRLTGRAGTKVGLSDPRIRSGSGSSLSDKSYPGDNRLVAPESSYRRRGSTPRCRLSVSWG
jgi:hypothetical protein